MNAIVKFEPARLPYHAAIQDRFQIDPSGWKTLVDVVFPLAKSHDSVVMALSYCKARKLDVFKRPVHIVPMWSSVRKQMVDTIWPGVAELRTTAFRTCQYAGADAAAFGEWVEREFSSTDDKGNEVKASVRFPEWCQITVYRMLHSQRVAFTSPKVYWLEAYARVGKTDVPNEMWRKRPVGQLEKCAEAAALRRAFPEEIGNEYTAEEMEGQAIVGEAIPLPPAPPSAPAIDNKAPPSSDFNPEAIIAEFTQAAADAKTGDELEAAFMRIVDPFWNSLRQEDADQIEHVNRMRSQELEP